MKDSYTTKIQSPYFVLDIDFHNVVVIALYLYNQCVFLFPNDLSYNTYVQIKRTVIEHRDSDICAKIIRLAMCEYKFCSTSRKASKTPVIIFYFCRNVIVSRFSLRQPWLTLVSTDRSTRMLLSESRALSVDVSDSNLP